MKGWKPPKKQNNKLLHHIAFTDYHPYIFGHFSNPQHIRFPYMPHQPYSQPFQPVFTNTSISHYNLIIYYSNLHCTLNTAHTTSPHHLYLPHTHYRFVKLVNTKTPTVQSYKCAGYSTLDQ